MPPTSRTAVWFVGASVLPATVALLLVPLESRLTTASVAVILVIPVVAVATSARRSAAIAATLSAVLSFDFLFTEPRRSFRINNADDLVLVVSLLVVGLVVAELAMWGQRQRATANRFVSDVTVLRSIAELIAIGEDRDSLAMAGAYSLRELLDLQDCRLAIAGDPPSPARITTTGEVVVGQLRWSPEHQGLPGPEVDLPLHAQGVVVGRFILRPTPGALIPADRLFTATALADLIGSAAGFRPNGVPHAA